MTKKHFIALADYMKAFLETNAGHEMDGDTKRVLFQHLTWFCEAQNGNFNRDRWLGYIAGTNGPSGGKHQ